MQYGKIKVRPVYGAGNNPVKNQYIIETEKEVIFQSYNSIIAVIENGKLMLDEFYWDYSVTTSRYRNQFTGLTTEETKKRIATGEIILTNLN